MYNTYRNSPAHASSEILQENQRLRARLAAVAQELDHIRETNDALRQRLVEQNHRLQARLAVSEEEVARVREENVALLATLEQELSEVREENATLRNKLAAQGRERARPAIKSKLKVTAVIPAHNEDRSIAPCIESLARQTYPLKKIIVVNDCSTDWTELVVQQHLCKKYPQVVCINKKADRSLRAGAVNKALKSLYENDCDLVLIVDADAVLACDVVEAAVNKFEQDEKIGGMCSSVELRGQGLLYRLQKLEYGGFNADRTATWRNIMIIHGLCGIYRLKALQEIGGYTVGHLLEDYDLTIRLKKAGWKTVFNPRMRAQADSVLTLRQLTRQRLCWMRGGVEILLEHGINRFTFYDTFNHIHFALLLAIVGAIVGWGITAHARWSFQPLWHPIPIALVFMGWLGSLWQLKWIKGVDWTDVALRLAIIPELIYYTFLSLLRLYAYWLVFISAEKRW